MDLSKGLGCPVGAVLAGSRTFIDDAWRWKQRIGGAMRQAGMLAAAGLYTFEHHIEQLAQDHNNARRFAEIVRQHENIKLNAEDIETNIVFMDISETGLSAFEISLDLEAKGINIGAFSESILRVVTHLDVDHSQIEQAGQEFLNTVAGLKNRVP